MWQKGGTFHGVPDIEILGGVYTLSLEIRLGNCYAGINIDDMVVR